MLIDTHAHLFWDSYKEDFDQVLEHAVNAGVTTIINVGVDVKSSQICAELESLRQDLTFYSSIAIHPEAAIHYSGKSPESRIEEEMQKLEQIYQQYPDKVVAVGECGLDFAYANWEGYLPDTISKEEMKDLQRLLFQAHIDLAKKLGLPLLLHIRDDRTEDPGLIECWDEVFTMAGDHYGILHCYSGLMETTKRALNSQFLVSFAGNATYKKNEYLREAIKILPLEKIVLETDSPFLPPQSIRGKRNEPSSIREIAALVAEIKGVSLEDVAAQTSKNVFKLLKKS